MLYMGCWFRYVSILLATAKYLKSKTTWEKSVITNPYLLHRQSSIYHTIFILQALLAMADRLVRIQQSQYGLLFQRYITIDKAQKYGYTNLESSSILLDGSSRIGSLALISITPTRQQGHPYAPQPSTYRARSFSS